MKVVRGILYGVLIILILSCFALGGYKLYDLKQQSKKEEPEIEEKKEVKEEQPKKLSLVMVGDSLFHSTVYNNGKNADGTYDFKKMLTQIKPIVQNYDLAFYNQESILGGTSLGLSTYPRFNSPQEVGDAFLDAGFNLVSLANNHSLDRGEEALNNSLAYWATKDAYTAGSYASFEERDNIKIAERNGIKYALLAYTTVTNGLTRPAGKKYYLNVYDETQVKNDIKKVRSQVDLLMVSMHFGTEYTLKQTAEQEQIATYLASLGVDIIIGHHPHVIEPITYIDNTLVIYSLGNFISGQRTIDQLSGVMVGVDITKEKDQPISLSNLTAELTYTKTKNAAGAYEYEVIPYNNLTDDILQNKDEHKAKYAEVLNSLGANVLIK